MAIIEILSLLNARKATEIVAPVNYVCLFGTVTTDANTLQALTFNWSASHFCIRKDASFFITFCAAGRLPSLAERGKNLQFFALLTITI